MYALFALEIASIMDVSKIPLHKLVYKRYKHSDLDIRISNAHSEKTLERFKNRFFKMRISYVVKIVQSTNQLIKLFPCLVAFLKFQISNPQSSCIVVAHTHFPETYLPSFSFYLLLNLFQKCYTCCIYYSTYNTIPIIIHCTLALLLLLLTSNTEHRIRLHINARVNLCVGVSFTIRNKYMDK